MLGERIEQHLMVLGPTPHQGPGHAGGHRVFQHRVDVWIADPPLEVVTLELQLQHGQILDVDAQQKHAGAAFHDIGLAPVAALHLALVER